MDKKRVGLALTGSFCTYSKVIPVVKELVQLGYEVTPIMSENSYSTDTRFGKCQDFIMTLEDICKHKVICNIVEAEPIGPKNLLDILVIAPCTGNTLGKIANGIFDTSICT